MESVQENIAAPKRFNPGPVESREETIRIAKSHLRAVKAGKMLEESGVPLSSIAKLSNVSPGEFAALCSSMSLSQATLLRDYFTSLMEFAEATGCGEVVLSSVCTDTIKLVVKNSGRISFLHDLVNVVVAMKVFESGVEAKKNSNLLEDLQEIRELETKFEQCGAKMSGKFVA